MKTVVFEGFDGSGKTTLAQWLSDSYGFQYHKSPTGLFKEVRDYFDRESSPLQDRLCFYFADCLRLSMLLSSPLEGNHVIDRYYYSTIAYHESKQKGITSPILKLFRDLKQPDLVILIKTDFDILSERIHKRGENALNDKLFLTREIYESVYSSYEKNMNVPYIIIDNNGNEEESREQIKKALLDFKID